MKWIILCSVLLLSSCGCYRTAEVVDYRQVVVSPVYDRVVVYDPDPVDVTITDYDYY